MAEKLTVVMLEDVFDVIRIELNHCKYRRCNMDDLFKEIKEELEMFSFEIEED